MFRFLHLADLHLGAAPVFLGDLAQDRAKDYLDAFRRAVDYAVDPANDIHAVLIVGDFFDVACPPQDVVRFAVSQLKRLNQSGIPVIVTPGNHDGVGATGSVYQNPEIKGLARIVRSPQVQLVETLEVNGEHVSLYGMAWDAISKPPFDIFRKVDTAGYHIAMIHGTLSGGLFVGEYSREVPLELDNLAQCGMDYIALGHIHTFQEKRVSGISVVYPGTLEGRRFSPGEEGERFLVVVTLEGRKSAKIDRLKWNRKTLQTARIDLDRETIESEQELANFVRGKYGSKEVLLRLILEGSPTFLVDVESLMTRLSGDFYGLEIDDRTHAFDSITAETLAKEETIRGLYIRKLRQHLEDAEADDKSQVELALKLGIQAFQKTSDR